MLGAFPLHVHALFTRGYIYGSLLAAAFLEFSTIVIGPTEQILMCPKPHKLDPALSAGTK